MKASRILGVIALLLAAVIIFAGVQGKGLRGGEELANAVKLQSAIDSHVKASEKTAPSALKKAENAVKGAETCAKDMAKTVAALNDLDTLVLAGNSGDEVIDTLRASGAAELADKMLLDIYKGHYADALKVVNNAETKVISAIEGINDVYTGAGLENALSEESKTEGVDFASPDAYSAAIKQLDARTLQLNSLANSLIAEAEAAADAAATVAAADTISLKDRALLILGNSYIGVLFTGGVLLLIAIVMIFFARKFASAWKKYPIFSTFIALFVLLIIQVYALGFNFDTVGEWARFWLSNMLNVLRSNSSVGMIALGMTLVIITGGIDLAVGSTLAGVSTVVMVLLDVSDGGILTRLGITGLPNYLIAVAAGLLAGVLIGLFNGIGITKGRIPPFIITLGVMNIVRSVAQYFTKGYKTEVPKAFQVLANAEIGGAMLLPIIYWLVLAVFMYIIAKHTAFGRHIYAVGSNERTSRLSGINVNRVKIGVYVLMGLIVGMAAVVQVARLRGVDVASAGSGYEMNAIAAVVVGGTSMAGGRGSIEGTVLGVLIIGIMNNLLVLLGIDAFLANAFTGAIIICAVLMQRKEK